MNDGSSGAGSGSPRGGKVYECAHPWSEVEWHPELGVVTILRPHAEGRDV